MHRGYGGFARADRRFDVAVLIVEGQLPPARYPTQVQLGDLHAGQLPRAVVVTGYGVLRECGAYPETLRAAGLLAHRFRWCHRHERDRTRAKLAAIDNKRQFCATAVDYPLVAANTCYADSGGPQFRLDDGDGALVQVGLTAFSFRACSASSATAWYIRL